MIESIFRSELFIACVVAFIFSLIVFFVVLHINNIKIFHKSSSHLSKTADQKAKELTMQRIRSEDRISEAKAAINVQIKESNEQVYFRLISTSNMLEALITLEVTNLSPYSISIARISWDLWRSGLHIKSGTYSDKVSIAPNGGKQEILLREVVHGSETADYAIGGQTATTGYLEGLLHCETEFGRFKKSFTLLDLRFSISEETRLKLKSYMRQDDLDGLTGLLERKFLENQLQNIINRNVPDRPVSFAMVDIDNFKFINDTYGHLAGDEVIRKICDTIKDQVGEVGLCIRYGGDEFAIVLQNYTLEDSKNLFEKIRSDIATLEFSQPQIKSTVSIGIAAIQEQVDFKTLVKNADDVLRVSKESGKNKLTVNQRKIRPETNS